MAARTKTKDEEEVDLLRIPSTRKMEKLRDILENDEDFRFDRIRLDNKKPRYELPEPTEDDEDNVELKGNFRGVVVLARKNFYLSDEDKKAGKEAKEKRALYVLRPGKLFPELLYVSPTGVRAWKALCKEVVEQGQYYFHVLAEFGAEFIDNSKKSGYKWSKPTFKIVRTLTEEEIAFVDELHALTDARVKEWENNSDLDDYEENALNLGKKSTQDDDDDEDEERVIDKHRKATRNNLERDKDDEDEKSTKSTRSRSKKDDDDDEEEKTSTRSRSRSKKDDDDEDDDKSSKSRSKKDDDDDDDEEEKKSSSRSRSKKDDDDDDEDDKKSSRSSRSRSKKDEDDEDDKPKSKGRSGYPSLDDDD